METLRIITIPTEHVASGPVKIRSVLVSSGDEVARGQALAIYTYMFVGKEEVSEYDGNGKVKRRRLVEMVREKEVELASLYDGKAHKMLVHPGDTITSSDQPIMELVESCSHDVQYNGLCAICGKDLAIDDFVGSQTGRATIQISHDASGLTVSRAEAERLERETAERLLKQHKLSLIVDLDLTIIQATSDPTVGEWMCDETNVNYPATKDIHRFQLPGNPMWYYVKLRPTLAEFLAALSRLYELHIYTMGTRAYASAVAKLIDPTGIYFSERIVSRDESGYGGQKKLQRLFPCDQSMVVVIDDREDVWGTGMPNLVRVRQYDFFRGVGDINGAVLGDKVEGKLSLASTSTSTPPLINIASAESTHTIEDATSTITATAVVATADASESTGGLGDGVIITAKADTDILPTPPKDDSDGSPSVETLAALDSQQTVIIKQQTEERPLAQKQRELPIEQPLLVDNDMELPRVLGILKEVHRRFYTAIEAGSSGNSGNLSTNPTDINDVADAQELIPRMKMQVLKNCILAFSSVIPLGVVAQQTEIWKTAERFGAVVVDKISKDVTHVVAGKPGTAKVLRAKELGVPVVSVEWFWESVARWERANEEAFQIQDFKKKSVGRRRKYGIAVETEDQDQDQDQDQDHEDEEIKNPEMEPPPELDSDDENDITQTEEIEILRERQEKVERNMLNTSEWSEMANEIDEELLEDGEEIDEFWWDDEAGNTPGRSKVATPRDDDESGNESSTSVGSLVRRRRKRIQENESESEGGETGQNKVTKVSPNSRLTKRLKSAPKNPSKLSSSFIQSDAYADEDIDEEAQLQVFQRDFGENISGMLITSKKRRRDLDDDEYADTPSAHEESVLDGNGADSNKEEEDDDDDGFLDDLAGQLEGEMADSDDD